MFFSRVFQVVTWAGVCVSVGCAVGNPGDIPCTSDLDCPSGQDCNVQQAICVQASIMTSTNSSTNNRVVPNSTPNNTTSIDPNNTTPDNNTNPNNTTSNNTTTTTAPTNNMTNTSACSPACEAPGTCVNGTCEYPDCAAAGNLCDPTVTMQNGFTCVDLGGGDGLCLDTCQRSQSPSNCAVGEYCLSYDGDNVCLPSFCDTNADCISGATTGTCIKIDNGFNYCKEAGALADHEPCDPADDQCTIGYACDPSELVCEPMCDPFAANCSPNHYCAFLLSPQTGLCTADTVNENLPRAPFSSCTPSGSVCDDATRCWSTGSGAYCLAYCRPGANDCAGITAGIDPTICDPYALYEPGTGICYPACSGSDCGVGYVCDAGLCRTPCTVGNEVADCCGGQSPCPAVCNPTTNFCE